MLAWRMDKMIENGRAAPNERRPAAVEPALVTVSRQELLTDGTDVDFRTLVHQILSFARCVATVRDGFGALVGITGVQYEIMMWVSRLEGSEGVTVGDISLAMRQSGAFTTIETGKLVEKGLLDKSPDLKDRRRVRLRCTPKWRESLRTLAPNQQRINDLMFGSLDADDFKELTRLMHDLVANADRAAHLMEFTLRQERGPAGRLGL